MGESKALLRLGKLSLIETVVCRLNAIFDEIVIVTSDADHLQIASLFNKGPALLRDAVEDKGPLGGLYTGLRSTKRPFAFVVACDMPLVNAALIRYMGDRRRGSDAVVPESASQHFEALHSFYARKCLGEIERQLAKNELSLNSLLPHLNVRYISVQEIRSIDPQMRSFVNVNTREDFRRIENDILR